LDDGTEVDGKVAFLLTELNRTICRSGDGKHMLTCFVGALDLSTGELIFANAGHNLPLIVRAATDGGEDRQGSKRRLTLQDGNVPIGIDATAEYRERKVRLAAGDKILMYTNGLYEGANAAGEP